MKISFQHLLFISVSALTVIGCVTGLQYSVQRPAAMVIWVWSIDQNRAATKLVVISQEKEIRRVSTDR